MKRFLTSAAFACVLSTSVLAGEVPSVGLNSPAHETTPTTTTTPGEIPTSGVTDEISDAALNLIRLIVGVVV